MKTNFGFAWQPKLTATPQFDAGRWKLRLEIAPVAADERAPIATDRQSAGPLVSRIAVSLTMLSPLFFLITAYLWACVVG